VELLGINDTVPDRFIPETSSDVFSVREKGKRPIITDFEEESQGVIDFSNERNEERNEARNRRKEEDEDLPQKPETTLRKVKHMQNLLKREGLSNKTMKENIDTFEDVPAYVRRNLSLGTVEKANESKLSKFTLTSNDNDEPLLRENNAYLNDNVD